MPGILVSFTVLNAGNAPDIKIVLSAPAPCKVQYGGKCNESDSVYVPA